MLKSLYWIANREEVPLKRLVTLVYNHRSTIPCLGVGGGDELLALSIYNTFSVVSAYYYNAYYAVVNAVVKQLDTILIFFSFSSLFHVFSEWFPCVHQKTRSLAFNESF